MRTTLCARTIENGPMATFRRAVVPGATYFFTVTTYQRMNGLTNAPFYSALKSALMPDVRTHSLKSE